MSEKKTIYNLDLHENIVLTQWVDIIRVLGGCIYEFISGNEWANNSVFVLFNEEFRPDDEESAR